MAAVLLELGARVKQYDAEFKMLLYNYLNIDPMAGDNIPTLMEYYMRMNILDLTADSVRHASNVFLTLFSLYNHSPNAMP